MIIEKEVRSFLAASMGVPVYVEVPAKVPEEYITIQRTAGSELNHLRGASIAVRCISRTSKLSAAVMCETAIVAMRSLVAAVSGVTACKLNSSYDNTLVSTKEYCYQAVFNINYMEE